MNSSAIVKDISIFSKTAGEMRDIEQSTKEKCNAERVKAENVLAETEAELAYSNILLAEALAREAGCRAEVEAAAMGLPERGCMVCSRLCETCGSYCA